MFHYFLQLNFATILISFFMLIFVNENPVFQRKVIRLFSIADEAMYANKKQLKSEDMIRW